MFRVHIPQATTEVASPFSLGEVEGT